MLIVLGDISARGSKLTERKWVSVLQQFQVILGPIASLPYHVVFGDRDIGDCRDLDQKFVREIASNLPGLDSYGSGSFQISNISFVSLNAVALLCGDNNLRFGVEKLIERESMDLQSVLIGSSREPVETKEETMGFSDFNWRANNAASGSGPVLLLHFPLHRAERNNFGRDDLREGNLGHNPCGGLKSSRNRGVIDGGPYERIHTLPPNATEYIFQSLKPRMVFSAHTHYFCDHIHRDGTREVTVPGMTWATRGEPGFVMVTFKENNVVLVGHCSLSSESRVLAAYVFMFILLLVVATLWAR